PTRGQGILMRIAAVLAFLGVFAIAPAVRADAEVQRLLAAKGTLAWTVAPTGKAQRYGHAEALVDAPVDKVRDTAVDFARYKELHKKFESARVVGKDPQGTDVYLKLAVKVGPFKVDQWSVMRFGPPRALHGGGWMIEGRETKGNMKDGHLVITIRPIDANHAVLKVDL